MSLNPVAQGDNHVEAHNDERDAINDLTTLVTEGRLSESELTDTIGMVGGTMFDRIQVVNPGGLRRFWLALGKRQSSPVRVAVAGNSKREGTGATNNVDRFPLALQDRLRRAFQPSGVPGAIESNIHLAGMNPVPAGMQYTVSGGSAAGSQYGFGGRGFKLIAGVTVMVTFYGDRVLIHYLRAGGGSLIDFSIDGGAVQTVDSYTNGAQAVATFDTGPLSRGAHTITMTRNAGSAGGRDGYIGDVQAFDGDYAKGVRVFDASRHGVTALDLSAAQGGWYIEFQAIGGFELVIIGLGENDAARSKAQYKSDILALIAKFRAFGFTGSFLLMHDAKPGNIADAALWASFGEAEKEIALADADVASVDLSRAVPAYDVANALGVYADDRHCTSAGQGWQADLVAAALAPRVVTLA
jgi:hypothetical protein